MSKIRNYEYLNIQKNVFLDSDVKDVCRECVIEWRLGRREVGGGLGLQMLTRKVRAEAGHLRVRPQSCRRGRRPPRLPEHVK